MSHLWLSKRFLEVSEIGKQIRLTKPRLLLYFLLASLRSWEQKNRDGNELLKVQSCHLGKLGKYAHYGLPLLRNAPIIFWAAHLFTRRFSVPQIRTPPSFPVAEGAIYMQINQSSHRRSPKKIHSELTTVIFVRFYRTFSI